MKIKEKLKEFKHRVLFAIYDNTALKLCKLAYFLEETAAPYFDSKAGKHYTEKMQEEAERAYKNQQDQSRGNAEFFKTH
jgi:hypothetical protein